MYDTTATGKPPDQRNTIECQKKKVEKSGRRIHHKRSRLKRGP